MGEVAAGLAEDSAAGVQPAPGKAEMIAVSAHERRLRSMRCVLTGLPYVTLHHCRGGSVAQLGWGVGVGQKQNPFLQIPLNGEYHVGSNGIDYGYGVESWEQAFGTQVQLLERVNAELPYDIWEQALLWHAEHRRNTRPGRRP